MNIITLTLLKKELGGKTYQWNHTDTFAEPSPLAGSSVLVFTVTAKMIFNPKRSHKRAELLEKRFFSIAKYMGASAVSD